ncbi:hypothetical protein QQP08_027213 [Theobroma cacao]|nr:hypothetical protein QQP08_027213 [Theobroma cacao]
MNVEGDFRYVESGAFDECADFLEYLNDYQYDWEGALAGWCSMSRRSVLFRPGGPLACELARHAVVLKINAILEETLQAVGAKAMVVGHTPQYLGANCAYNCSIWRIDVGMSSGDVYEVNLFPAAV